MDKLSDKAKASLSRFGAWCSDNILRSKHSMLLVKKIQLYSSDSENPNLLASWRKTIKNANAIFSRVKENGLQKGKYQVINPSNEAIKDLQKLKSKLKQQIIMINQ